MTSDISFLIKVIWCQTSNVGLLLSYNCYLIFCHMSHIRHLMCDVWFQTSDIYRTSDVCYQANNIRCLITVIWQKTSDVIYLISDVWCLLSDFRHDVRRLTYTRLLMSDFWHIPDVCCQTSAVCYQTSDVRCLIPDFWCQTLDVWYQTKDIRHLITAIWQRTLDVCYQTFSVR